MPAYHLSPTEQQVMRRALMRSATTTENQPVTTLAPHQQRVVDERGELADRLDKLLAFLKTPIFASLDVDERVRMRTQVHHMICLHAVLTERIEAFGVIPAATEAQKIEAARTAAHRAADAAEKAWYELAGLIDVGPDRTYAFQVYENLRHARRA